MTAKDRLRKLVDGLDERQAEDALGLVEKRLDSPLAARLPPLRSTTSRQLPKKTKGRAMRGASTSAARR